MSFDEEGSVREEVEVYEESDEQLLRGRPDEPASDEADLGPVVEQALRRAVRESTILPGVPLS